MSITTYSELKTALTNWTHRPDSDDRLSEFITLAEARINRGLRVRQMEEEFPSTAISSYLVTRPTDAVAFKALWSDTNRTPAVEQKSLEFVMSHSSDGAIPQYYAWKTDSLRFNTSSGTVAGVYYQAIPALSASAPTNWLLTLAPDLYLKAAMTEAYQYALDPLSIEYEARTLALIEELNTRDSKDRFSGNSLVVRTA
jgi:hypothetical protein